MEVVIHELKPVPVNLDAPLNVPYSVVTLPTLHPLRSAIISPADTKVLDREVMEVVIHELKPVPTNLDAKLNVCASVVTLPTLHQLRSAFISPATQKVRSREVTEVVIHLLMSVPTNVAALGLPFTKYVPPTFRYLENA
jgi:hypothetical protein